MAIEIVDFPMKIAWWIFPVRYVNVYQRVYSIFQPYCWLLSISISHCDDLLTDPHISSVSRCLSAGRVERRVYFCPWIVLANIPMWLVVWNIFYDFPYIGKNHPNWRTHIVQRGRYTTNQQCSLLWFPFVVLSRVHSCHSLIPRVFLLNQSVYHSQSCIVPAKIRQQRCHFISAQALWSARAKNPTAGKELWIWCCLCHWCDCT